MKRNFGWMLIFSSLSLGLGTSFAQDKPAGGDELFAKHCKRCHAEDGSGQKDGQPLKIATTLKLEKAEVLNLLRDDAKKATDADIKKAMTDGKGKMKKVDAAAADLDTLVKYVRYLQAQKK